MTPEELRPTYYRSNGGTNLECWDVWEGMGVLEPACVAIIIKYLWRYGRKDNEYLEDLVKARTYLNKLIESLGKDKEIDPQTAADMKAGIVNQWTESIDADNFRSDVIYGS